MDLALLAELKLIACTPLMYNLGQESHLTFYSLIFSFLFSFYKQYEHLSCQFFGRSGTDMTVLWND